MISDRVRFVLGTSLMIVLGGAWAVSGEGSESDCSRWLRLGQDEASRAENVRQTHDVDALIDHLEKSRDAFAKAMKACPDSAKAPWIQVQSRLAYCRYKGGHFGDACDTYAELLKLEPSRAMDRAIYADALEQSGEYTEAVEQFQSLIQAGAQHQAAFYCNMALIYALEVGDGAQAVETAKRGIDGAGNLPCLQFAWGKGLVVSGVRMLETPDTNRGLELLDEAKLKFAALKDDPDYGGKARAELNNIERIQGERSRKAKEKR